MICARRLSLLVLVAVVGMFTVCPAQAAPPAGKFAGKGKGEMMKRIDKDGDGKLSEQEKEAAKAAFKHRAGGGAAGPGRDEVLKRFDKNGDGQLGDDEKAAAKAEFQKRWDAKK